LPDARRDAIDARKKDGVDVVGAVDIKIQSLMKLARILTFLKALGNCQ
jgi:hypothetical protein